jgi:hypothetical protein
MKTSASRPSNSLVQARADLHLNTTHRDGMFNPNNEGSGKIYGFHDLIFYLKDQRKLHRYCREHHIHPHNL